ncbi:glycosyltransferase [Alkaliphilus sp. MSJ-5]|uniref:Glycosyltransferase n=1 Tax=Alkaliphilus flagellatus TaxID=2841507 RepID=A0ABS6FY49_9FIRM|nr:glycosyltransferase family 2 protein [Alkaliphilus flagellatus]MBU5675160.1 glycosyltransferase [Alkaliphilus flagellatus]
MASFWDRESGLVSVIIAIYNYEKYICEALDGLKNQTYSNIEIIIIDDCSTDNTKQVISEWIKNNEGVFWDFTYIRLPRNCSQTWALNIGFCVSKGEYIAIHDSDDISHKEKIQKQVEYLDENYNVTVVGTGFKAFTEHINNIVYIPDWLSYSTEKIESNYKNEFKHCVCFGSVLFRANILENIIGCKRFVNIANDVFFINEIIHADYIVSNLKEDLLYVRTHPERATEEYREAMQKIKEESKKVIGKVSVILPIENNKDSIFRSLKDISIQTYLDIEIIIIDDALENSYEEEIRKWYSQYKQENPSFNIKDIIYFRLPTEIGYPWVYNVGSYLSKGEFIAFNTVNSISNNAKLSKQVEFLNNNFMYSVIGTNSTEETPIIKFDDDIEYIYTKEYTPCVNINTIMLRSVVVDHTAGMNKSIDKHEDFEFIHRLINNGYRVQNLKDVLHYEV